MYLDEYVQMDAYMHNRYYSVYHTMLFSGMQEGIWEQGKTYS